jgi:hypothetical protein
MSEENKQAIAVSKKVTNAAVSLTLLWVGAFVCGVGVIILFRVWLWMWRITEL